MGTFNFIDITGEKFGMLTVIRLNVGDFHDCTRWECVCDCGNKTIAKGRDLKRGKTKSCGCLRGKFKDLTGNKYNKLTVLSLYSKRPSKWNCLCECGNTHIVLGASLKSGGTKSCGCLYKTRVHSYADLTGQRFSRLIVLYRDLLSKKPYWFCKCDCGKITRVHVSNIKTGHTKSCGCFNSELITKRLTTHGCTKINKRLYGIWRCMIFRCTNPKHGSFDIYGGRGISVCKEWSDCLTFFQWAFNNGYRSDLLLDRRDNDDGYSPENCRWVTHQVQMQNTSRSLGEQKVREIKELLKTDIKQNIIAEMYHVHTGIITEIKKGRTYSNI